MEIRDVITGDTIEMYISLENVVSGDRLICSFDRDTTEQQQFTVNPPALFLLFNMYFAINQCNYESLVGCPRYRIHFLDILECIVDI